MKPFLFLITKIFIYYSPVNEFFFFFLVWSWLDHWQIIDNIVAINWFVKKFLLQSSTREQLLTLSLLGTLTLFKSKGVCIWVIGFTFHWKHTNNKKEKKLLSFEVDLAERFIAMSSKNFLHPVLQNRKIKSAPSILTTALMF